MEQEIKRSWWNRNWKWAAPVGGCLTIIIIGISLLVWVGYKAIDEISEETNVFAFIEVVSEVNRNKELREALGKPVDVRDGDYDPESDPNSIDLDMGVYGPNGEGTLLVKGTNGEDGWIYTEAKVTIDGTNQVIDLLDELND